MLRELAAQWRSLLGEPDTLPNALLNVLLHESFPSGSWKPLYNFLNRAYWNRLWIMEEVVMSHEVLAACCGEEGLHWSDIAQAIEVLGMNAGIMLAKFQKDQEEEGFEHFKHVEPNNWYLLERMQRLHTICLTEVEGETLQDLMELLLASR